MDVTAVAQRIAALDFLSALPAETRAQIAEVFVDVSDVLRYDEGDALINAGYLSFNTGLVLIDGEATLEWDDQDSVDIAAPILLGEMAQFKSMDLRSATVRAKSSCVGAQFYWDDLYSGTQASLPKEALQAFHESIQLKAWDRFQYKEILELPLFADLSETVRLKVCRPLSTLSELLLLKEIDTLFNEGSSSQSTGYLLVSGQLKLLRKDGKEKILSAPNLLGIFPNKGEKGKDWSATAMASGPATLLKFSWEQFTEHLLRNLSRDEQKAYIDSIKQNAGKHFWH